MEKHIKWHVDVSSHPTLGEIHKFMKSRGEVIIVTEGGHVNSKGKMVKLHYQGLIRFKESLKSSKQIEARRKKLTNDFSSVKNGFGKQGAGKFSFGAFKSDAHLENYITYLCKGPSELNKLEPLINFNELLDVSEVQKRQDSYWELAAIKDVKKNAIKIKKQTIGEAYFQFMSECENVPFYKKSDRRTLIISTRTFFSNAAKRGDFNTIVGYVMSWIHHKYPSSNMNNLIIDKIESMLEMRECN